MRSIRTTVAASCAALALTAGMAAAQTVPPDRTTFVTFSGPVSVPGTTLPAGTYTFRLLNSDTNRNIVQIFNREGTKLVTTLLAVPATRMEPTGDPIITFKETPSDRPPAVHYWYYAGDLAGNELVYPKDQAMMIASASGEPVMSVDSNGSSIDDWKSGSMSRVKPGNTDQSATPAASTTSSSTTSSASTTSTASSTTSAQQPQSTAPMTAQPTTTAPTTAQPTTTTPDQPTQPTTTAQPTTAQPTTAPMTAQPTTTMDQTAQPSAPAPTTAPTTAPSTPDTVGTSGRTKSLPHTASELPMVGLIGLFALGGALALRASRAA
jgi:hypothetical protein